MFEPGRFYTVTMRRADVEGDIQIFTYEVTKVELPLVKFKCPDGREMIINTSSSAFISAVPRKATA
jgi:hypothetical protein